MPKFSIIIPVFNAEPYLIKCLDSVFKQSYQDFEVIIINDGSTDTSEKLIKDYVKDLKNITYISKPNTGVSDCRNIGIENSNGEYLMFVDADDYIDINTLKIVNSELMDCDVLSYNLKTVDQSSVEIMEYHKPIFDNLPGYIAIQRIIDDSKLFDTPVAYVYKRQYLVECQFKYAAGHNHEDFGLTPIIIAFAKSVKSIGNVLYYNVQSTNSVVRSQNDDQLIKNAEDMIWHYNQTKNYFKTAKLNDVAKNKILSFMANSIINKTAELPINYQSRHIDKLRALKVFKDLESKTILQKIKKLIIKISIPLYLKIK